MTTPLYHCPSCEKRELRVVRQDIDGVALACDACGHSLVLNRRIWLLFLERPDDRMSDFLLLADALGYTGTE
ncbi:MAG: hypothetical protein GKC04_04320 [Methanomicrobiales archaeon]|nr:hypothetical protein [Methanomicrobiales archaeon]